MVNFYIVYELNIWSKDLNAEFTLTGRFFGNGRITKNGEPNKYSYSGCGIGFDSCSLILLQSDWGKNVIIFGVDMNSYVHANNKNKDILILSKGQTQGLDNTVLTAEVQYSINFSKSEIKFCLNRSNSFLFVNSTKIHQFKEKDSEIKA